ncbi:MAG: sigma factor-like helix-turn-helix DNA-binding protein, partial [Pseudomonadota bacterium]
RAKQVRESNEDAFARLIEGNTASSAEEAVHWTQAVDTFEATLNQLNPITREIFVRCALDDEPRLEVAKSLGLHVSTVEKRLAKARRSCFEAIREFLEP